MAKDAEKLSIDYEKIFVYLAIISLLITFWQSWRDVHTDMSNIKERTAKLEIRFENLEKK